MIEVTPNLGLAIQADGMRACTQLGASQAIQLGERLVRLGLRALFREEAADAPLAPIELQARQR